MFNKNKVTEDKLDESEKMYNFTNFKLFLTWFQIGATSFGGGATTQYLIQEKFIYKYEWITKEEYATILGVSQMAPGINIISYAILIGKKLGGWRGVIAAIIGLIFPSAAITVFLTAIYSYFGKSTRVHSMIHTLFPAIFGITIATNWRNIGPIVKKNYKKGKSVFAITIGIMIGISAIYLFVNPSVILLYILGALCGALTYWYISKKKDDK